MGVSVGRTPLAPRAFGCQVHRPHEAVSSSVDQGRYWSTSASRPSSWVSANAGGGGQETHPGSRRDPRVLNNSSVALSLRSVQGISGNAQSYPKPEAVSLTVGGNSAEIATESDLLGESPRKRLGDRAGTERREGRPIASCRHGFDTDQSVCVYFGGIRNREVELRLIELDEWLDRPAVGATTTFKDGPSNLLCRFNRGLVSWLVTVQGVICVPAFGAIGHRLDSRLRFGWTLKQRDSIESDDEGRSKPPEPRPRPTILRFIRYGDQRTQTPLLSRALNVHRAEHLVNELND